MAIIASDKGSGEFRVVPAGTHIAICTMVVDCGIQAGGKFKPSRKVYLRWELPGETVEWKDRDGQEHSGPMIIGKQYTLSLSEKANLRNDLEAWRGRVFTEAELKGFDVVNVLGKACMLGVTHNTQGAKTYANISAVMGLPKGTKPPEPFNALVTYSVEEHDQAVFDALPKWLQDVIGQRVKNNAAPTLDHKGHAEDFEDDIPF